MNELRRNQKRFPDNFMFQLTKEGLENWRSQIATANPSAKVGLRRRPYAFTEHGAIMAATVLNSPRADLGPSGYAEGVNSFSPGLPQPVEGYPG
jgi:hypothetical protein